MLGNDLAGRRVCGFVSEEPSEVPETMVLERGHPEVFTACVVTWAQALAAEKGNSSKQDELMIWPIHFMLG